MDCRNLYSVPPRRPAIFTKVELYSACKFGDYLILVESLNKIFQHKKVKMFLKLSNADLKKNEYKEL